MRAISKRLLVVSGAILAFGVATTGYADMGRTAGSHGVSPSGAATYAIPIWTQPGPKGMQPTLAFSYNSQSGNGTMGVGWGLSGFASVERCPSTAAEDGADKAVAVDVTDRFCIGGNKLRITSGALSSYGTAGAIYQTQFADFSRVTSVGTAGTGPESFRVDSKDGLIYEYGVTADSRVILTGSTVYRWLLNKVSDREGNSYVISYTTNNSVGRVPLSVSWGNTTANGSTYQYQAYFTYSTKTNEKDIVYARQNNIWIPTKQRLDSVTVGYSASGSGYQTKRQYALTYVPSPTTGVSRLTQVKECAATTSTCLKPTIISYQSGVAGVSSSGNVGPGGISGKYDFNGDGRSDIWYSDGTTWRVAFSTGSGFGAGVSTGIAAAASLQVGRFLASHQDGFLVNVSGTWSYVGYNGSSFTTTSTGTTVTASSILTDYNGDGLQDFVWTSAAGEAGGWVGRVHLRLNTTTGAATVPSFDTTVYAPLAMGLGQFGGNIAIIPPTRCPVERQCDINGDGAADLTVIVITTLSCTGGPGGCTPVQTGYDLVTGSFGYYLANATAGVTPYLGIRFNDDRCTDTIKFGTTDLKINGCGSGASVTVSVPAQPIAVMDWDGDGKTDLLTNNGGTVGVYKSTGSATSPFSSLITTTIPSTGCTGAADVDGDGLDELVCGSTYYTHNGGGSAGGIAAFATQIPDLVNNITDGYGVIIIPSYVSTAQSNYIKGSGTTLPLVDATDPMIVVGRMTISDGLGTSYDVNYSYKGARRHGKLGPTAAPGTGPSGTVPLELLYGPDGQSAGFEQVSIVDSRNTLLERTTYEQLFPLVGMLKKGELYQSDQATPITIETNTNLWEALDATINNKRYFPYISQTATDQYEVGGSLNGQLITNTTRTVVYSTFTYGNIFTDTTVKIDKDPNNSTPFLNSTWTTAITNSYDSPLTSGTDWCVGFLNQSVVAQTSSAPGAGAVTRTIAFGSDTGSPSKCRIKTKTTEPGSSKYKIAETYSFDAFGNISQVSVVGRQPVAVGSSTYGDMPARNASIDWGTTGQFPTTVTDASGASIVYTMNYDVATLEGIADPNSTGANVIKTSYVYDPFNRKTRETRPDGTYTTWAYNDCTSTGCFNGRHVLSVVESTLDRLGAPLTDAQLFYDAFDRKLVSRTKLLDGTYQWQESDYDSRGRKFHEYVPCKSSSATSSCATLSTAFTYDSANRLIQTTRPRSSMDSTPQYTYQSFAGRVQTATDAQSRVSTRTLNVDGTMRQTKDANNFAINFTYDAAGALTGIVDSLGNVRLSNVSVEYGKKPFTVSAIDSALGLRTSKFNSFGDRVEWADAKAQAFSATYDPLSRPLSTRLEPSGTPSATWTWGADATAFNKGQLASISSTENGEVYAENYTYDNRARLKTAAIAIPGEPAYMYEYLYDADKGWLSSIKYPEVMSGAFRLQLNFGYQNAIMRTVSDAGSGTVYWSANASNARGQITQEALGNGVTTTRSFDGVTSWLGAIQSGVTATPAGLQNLAFLHDLVGNVTQRQDIRQGLTEEFVYGSATDNLYRIEHSTVSNFGTNLSMTYDATGNILTKNETGNEDPLFNQTITWTPYDYPLQISANGEVATFAYGPNRQRWKMRFTNSSVDETTLYVGSLLEKVTVAGVGTTYRHTILGGEAPVAIRTVASGSDVTRYVLGDHQGSIETLADSAAAPVARESFTAFGQRRDAADWVGAPMNPQTLDALTRQGYTYQTVLGVMGLNHMNGRVQDAAGGRFLSPDPYITDPNYTQNYNRYSYVFNNPVTFTDPSGFEDCFWTPGGSFPIWVPAGPTAPGGISGTLSSGHYPGFLTCNGGPHQPPNQPPGPPINPPGNPPENPPDKPTCGSVSVGVGVAAHGHLPGALGKLLAKWNLGGGVSGGTSVGGSFGGSLLDSRLFLQVQAAGMVGGGLYAGVGINGQYSSDPVDAGINTLNTWHSEFNFANGPSVSGAIDIKTDGSMASGGGSASIKAGRLGIGYGIAAGTGAATQTTIATPTLRELWNKLMRAIAPNGQLDSIPVVCPKPG